MTGIAGSTFNAAPSSTGSGPATRRSRVVPFVAEHRDRLAQLGWECLAAGLLRAGRLILVVDPKEREQDLVWDMQEALGRLSARRYGQPSSRTRAHPQLSWAEQPVGTR